MSATTVDITGWSAERVAGFLTAARGDSAAVEISLVTRSDGERQLSMSISDERPSDFTARQCQVCGAITIARVLPLDGLPTPKTLDAGDAPSNNGNAPH